MPACSECHGSGRDEQRTEALAKSDAEFRHRVKHHGTYVACRHCLGNGLEPHYPDYSRHRRPVDGMDLDYGTPMDELRG